MVANNDWQDPKAATQSVVVPPFTIEREGLASTARVGRDAAIAGTIVGAALEAGEAFGWAPIRILAQSPNLLIAATGAVTVVVRAAWKWLGKYVV